jgi:hypothetical protein
LLEILAKRKLETTIIDVIGLARNIANGTLIIEAVTIMFIEREAIMH